MTVDQFADPSCRARVVQACVLSKEFSAAGIQRDVEVDLVFLLVWHEWLVPGINGDGMLPHDRFIHTLTPGVALSASATGALFSATAPDFSGELQEASRSLQVSRGS